MDDVMGIRLPGLPGSRVKADYQGMAGPSGNFGMETSMSEDQHGMREHLDRLRAALIHAQDEARKMPESGTGVAADVRNAVARDRVRRITALFAQAEQDVDVHDRFLAGRQRVTDRLTEISEEPFPEPHTSTCLAWTVTAPAAAIAERNFQATWEIRRLAEAHHRQTIDDLQNKLGYSPPSAIEASTDRIAAPNAAARRAEPAPPPHPAGTVPRPATPSRFAPEFLDDQSDQVGLEKIGETTVAPPVIGDHSGRRYT